jgi:hypothetical protein
MSRNLLVMNQPLAPIRVQFARAGNYYRLEASISRLLPRELNAVVAAFTETWTKPEEVERVTVGTESGEALAVTMMADHEIRAGERPADVARKMTYAIWQKLDRYVKVTVETTYLGESPDAHFEYGEAQYADAFGARFEQ